MIFEVVISLLAVAAFGLALWWTKIVTVARNAMTTTMAGLSAMMNSELDDDAKEIAVRRAGLSLIIASFNIFWRFCAALAAAAAPILLADIVGLVRRDAVFDLMLRWDYIIIVSVAAIVLSEIVRRWRLSAAGGSAQANRYSTADRFFHILAFSSPAVLKAASSIEDKLVSKPTMEPTAPPLFVTSLARAGTTALLNALHEIPGIATHTYRDMPFLTAPSLWSRLAGGKRHVERHQRAHGDGLEIDLDSPEAFEEVIWKLFWPEKFQEASIGLWRKEDQKSAADQFLKRHMSKVIRVRLPKDGDEAAAHARYCSKNNANVARIPYLLETFPGCQIVVPVRRPDCHAASLLRQHQNFLAQQAEDDFVRTYMRDIGHFEFGQIHKPLAFPGFQAGRYDPTTPDYWLHYWIQAFQEILKYSEHCIFVLQDDLRASPEQTMTDLCNRLDLEPGALKFADYFHGHPDQSPTDLYDPQLSQQAGALYSEFEQIVSSHESTATVRTHT